MLQTRIISSEEVVKIVISSNLDFKSPQCDLTLKNSNRGCFIVVVCLFVCLFLHDTPVHADASLERLRLQTVKLFRRYLLDKARTHGQTDTVFVTVCVCVWWGGGGGGGGDKTAML